MPLGYHSCPTNPPGIGLSDIRPVPAPTLCLPLLGRLVPHARMLYTSIYHPFFCIMAQVSLGYWRSSLQCCYFHISTRILGSGAPHTRRPGPLAQPARLARGRQPLNGRLSAPSAKSRGRTKTSTPRQPNSRKSSSFCGMRARRLRALFFQ